MVIGGGPAGMEASRIAALRGHQVTLYDKRKAIGGNLLLAATPSGKEKLLWFCDYEGNQLRKLKVNLKLGVEVTPELIDETKPEVVILAAGSEPMIPDIPGVKNRNVVTAWDVLEGRTKISGDKVIVAGGGTVGAETGEFLADQDNRVTLIELLPSIAEDMEALNRRGLMDALQEKKIAMLTEYEVNEITDQGVMVTNKKNKEKKIIEADWIVLAMGSKPAKELADSLQERVPRLYRVGDCQWPRTILAAVYEGASAALQI